MREFMSYPEWEMSNRLQEPSAHNFFQEGGKWKNIKPTKRAILETAKSFSLLESWHMVSYHNVQYYLQKTITQLPIIWKVSHYISFKLLQNEIQVQGKNETKKKTSLSMLQQKTYVQYDSSMCLCNPVHCALGWPCLAVPVQMPLPYTSGLCSESWNQCQQGNPSDKNFEVMRFKSKFFPCKAD